MPCTGSLHKIYSFAHDGFHYYHYRLFGLFCHCFCLPERFHNRFHLIALFDLYNVPAEGLPLLFHLSDTGNLLCRSVYLLPIAICNSYQVTYVMMSRKHSGLPNLPLLALSIAEKYPDIIRISVESLCYSRSRSYRKTLTERTGCNIDSRKIMFNRGMSLQATAELS